MRGWVTSKRAKVGQFLASVDNSRPTRRWQRWQRHRRDPSGPVAAVEAPGDTRGSGAGDFGEAVGQSGSHGGRTGGRREIGRGETGLGGGLAGADPGDEPLARRAAVVGQPERGQPQSGGRAAGSGCRPGPATDPVYVSSAHELEPQTPKPDAAWLCSAAFGARTVNFFTLRPTG